MSDDVPREEQMLCSLAELAFAAAREAHGRLMVAEDDDAFERASRSFQGNARCLRQTLALRARLKRQDQVAEREDRAEAAQARTERVKLRRRQVGIAVGRALEHEACDADEFDLDDLLDEEELSETFPDEDVPTLIARIRTRLGLAPTSAPVAAPTVVIPVSTEPKTGTPIPEDRDPYAASPPHILPTATHRGPGLPPAAQTGMTALGEVELQSSA